MKIPKLPIKAAKALAEDHNLDTVLILGSSPGGTVCTTYGRTVEHCDWVAQLGSQVKRGLGWPDNLVNIDPARVKKLKKQVTELERQLAEEKSFVATMEENRQLNSEHANQLVEKISAHRAFIQAELDHVTKDLASMLSFLRTNSQYWDDHRPTVNSLTAQRDRLTEYLKLNP